jgi:hypothetical protein
MPVYDNTNFISLAKQLIESAKQTSQLLQTVEFLKQQKENIEKVNNVIRQLKAVREIQRNNQRLFDIVQNDLRDILNSPYVKPEEVNRISESFNSIIENSLDNFEYIERILSNDFLKMTDAERAEVLRKWNYNPKKWWLKSTKRLNATMTSFPSEKCRTKSIIAKQTIDNGRVLFGHRIGICGHCFSNYKRQ